MSLIITKNFKRAKAQDSAATDANFKKGDKVTVKTKWAGTRKGIVKEVINDPALKKAYVVEIEGAETAAYPAEIVSADACDAAEFHVGQRVRAKDSVATDARFKVGDLVRMSEGGLTGKITKIEPNGHFRVSFLYNKANGFSQSFSANEIVMVKPAADASAAKFRIGQEVIVKTKFTEPYKARIVGLWDMSQNGPYNEQGYLIKNLKGGGVESMPEHALSLATANDSAELNNDANDSAAIVFRG